MTVTIPDPIAEDLGLDEKSALLELAFALYAQDRLSPSQVRTMTGIGFYDFERIALERGLPTNTVTEEEFRKDLVTLKKLGLW
jgi:predicted HTH domain antitoxin